MPALSELYGGTGASHITQKDLQALLVTLGFNARLVKASDFWPCMCGRKRLGAEDMAGLTRVSVPDDAAEYSGLQIAIRPRCVSAQRSTADVCR